MDIDIKDILLKSYNLNARLRDKQELDAWKKAELDAFLLLFEKNSNLKLLDVGAGSGQHSQYLKDHGLRVSCIDLSPEMVQTCKNKGLEAHVMDFYSIDFPPCTFDAVWSMNALLHVPKKSLDLVLTNIKKVLKSGGLFYLGLYGGYESEGIWDEDPYQPNRFFSFYEHGAIQEKVGRLFELVEFRVVPIEGIKADFQAMILKKM